GISPPAWVALSAVMALAACIPAGPAGRAWGVRPSAALFTPRLRFCAHAVTGAPDHPRESSCVARAQAQLVVLICVVSCLITAADTHDARFWAAMAVLLAIVALPLYVWPTQRVDHARRRAQGTQARVPGPRPPARPDRMREEPGSGPSPS